MLLDKTPFLGVLLRVSFHFHIRVQEAREERERKVGERKGGKTKIEEDRGEETSRKRLESEKGESGEWKGIEKIKEVLKYIQSVD